MKKRNFKKDNHHEFRIFWLCIIFAFLTLPLFGQNRTAMTNRIQQWGNCRVVAITETNGNVAISNRNDVQGDNIPASMANALTEYNRNGRLIKDVTLTENGSWLIIFDTNGYNGVNIPSGLLENLWVYNQAGDDILSASFNDEGDWVIVSRTRWTASNTDLANWLRSGQNQYGNLITVSLSRGSVAAVFNRGISFINAPPTLNNTLRQLNFQPHFVKIAGNSWFISDVNGNYWFNM